MDNYFYTNFEKLGHLGEGAFGEVFKVRDKMDEQFYAVKEIKDKGQLKFFLEEMFSKFYSRRKCN